MRINSIIILSLILLMPLFASAQEESLDDATTYDFDEDVIDGSTKSPEELYINSLKRSKINNLITIRKNFRKEIVKSAEGI